VFFQLLGTPSEKIWPGYKDLPGVQKMKFVDYPISHLRNRVGNWLSSIIYRTLLDPKHNVSIRVTDIDGYGPVFI
jgi:hypothetical protein